MTRLASVRMSSAVVGLLAYAAFSRAAEPPYANPPMPAYRVQADGFGARPADIMAICTSTGRELWRLFPGYHIEPFVVQRSGGGPIVLFDRNERGEIVMRLDTGNTYWSQYAYQFAHEFCHILCGFNKGNAGNKWFEETLAETASLFALRAMAESWEEAPPYPNWKDYRHSLRNYADNVMAKRTRIYEIYEKGLGGFYLAHKDELEENAGLRDLNGAMALVFLRLFEENPQRWEAVRWLNDRPSPEDETFRQYLQNWYDAVPERHRSFVALVAELYSINIAETGGSVPQASSPEQRAIRPRVGQVAAPGKHASLPCQRHPSIIRQSRSGNLQLFKTLRFK